MAESSNAPGGREHQDHLVIGNLLTEVKNGLLHPLRTKRTSLAKENPFEATGMVGHHVTVGVLRQLLPTTK